MRLPWLHRQQHLDDRLAEARRRAHEAAGEVEISRLRARRARETVVVPLRRRDDENQFAEMLRASLVEGYR